MNINARPKPLLFDEISWMKPKLTPSNLPYPSSINLLPNEILIEIFYHLDHESRLAASLVSKRFSDISRLFMNLRLKFIFTENGTYDGPIKLVLNSSIFPDAVEFKFIGDNFNETWERLWPDWEATTSAQYAFRLLEDLKDLRKIKFTVHDLYCMFGRHFLENEPVTIDSSEHYQNSVEELQIFHTYGSLCPPCLERLLSAFKNLVCLDLWYQAINDTELQIIFKTLPRIEELSLSGCLEITDKGLADPVQISSLTELRKLAMYKIKNITDLGISELKLPNLIELKLSRVEKISKTGVTAFVKGCPSLKFLYLYECISFNDFCVEAILKNLTQLQHLGIEGCQYFTARCKEMVQQYCPDPSIGIYLGADEE